MTNRYDLYEVVTNKILEQLERGVVPWVQPWKSADGKTERIPGMPYNFATGKAYRGVNIILLWLAGAYPESAWLTYNQARSLGGNVKTGEKATTVVFMNRYVSDEEKLKAAAENREPRGRFFLRSYNVFNHAQCEGLRPLAPQEPQTWENLVPVADALIKNTGAIFRVGGDKAFYSQLGDFIAIPAMKSYAPDHVNWYRTAFHELGHWTGAAHRLNRPLNNQFGDEAYAMEELVAELSAAYMCATLGVQPTVRHADYIGSWIRVLRRDTHAIVNAATKASKAADFVWSFEESNEEEAA